MFIQSVLVALWAWFNGGVVSEYLVWIVRGAVSYTHLTLPTNSRV